MVQTVFSNSSGHELPSFPQTRCNPHAPLLLVGMQAQAEHRPVTALPSSAALGTPVYPSQWTEIVFSPSLVQRTRKAVSQSCTQRGGGKPQTESQILMQNNQAVGS